MVWENIWIQGKENNIEKGKNLGHTVPNIWSMLGIQDYGRSSSET
jgi:hypothetical protein